MASNVWPAARAASPTAINRLNSRSRRASTHTSTAAATMATAATARTTERFMPSGWYTGPSERTGPTDRPKGRALQTVRKDGALRKGRALHGRPGPGNLPETSGSNALEDGAKLHADAYFRRPGEERWRGSVV